MAIIQFSQEYIFFKDALVLSKDIRQKRLSFGHCPKGGRRGSTGIQKCWGSFPPSILTLYMRVTLQLFKMGHFKSYLKYFIQSNIPSIQFLFIYLLTLEPIRFTDHLRESLLTPIDIVWNNVTSDLIKVSNLRSLIYCASIVEALKWAWRLYLQKVLLVQIM